MIGSTIIPYTYALIPPIVIPILYETLRTTIVIVLQLASLAFMWRYHHHRS